MKTLVLVVLAVMAFGCNAGPPTIEEVCEHMIECYDFTMEECLDTPWGMTEECAEAKVVATCEEMSFVCD